MKPRIRRRVRKPGAIRSGFNCGPRVPWQPQEASASFRVAGVQLWFRSLYWAEVMLAKFEETPRGGERQHCPHGEHGDYQSSFSRLPMKLKTSSNRAKVIKKLKALIKSGVLS